MRRRQFLLAAALLAPAVGCKWMDDLKNGSAGRPKNTGRIEPVAPEQLVGFLNDRAARLRSVEYADIRTHVSGKGLPLGANLDGSLAASQPHNFRMISGGRFVSAKVDMGSNDKEFWVYVAAPGDAPVYVFASHDDFESGKAKMPGGIPFEPEWVMQALGMKTFPLTNEYEQVPVAVAPHMPEQPRRRPDVIGMGNPGPVRTVQSVPINERDRTYTLRWPAKTPAGQQVVKEVVFDADAATGNRPQVKRHVIRDYRSNKVLASAEVKTAETVQVGTDPRSGLPMAVQYPTHMVLRWEDPKFEMDMTMGRAQVNQVNGDESARPGLFARPEYRGTTPIDLAGGFTPLK